MSLTKSSTIKNLEMDSEIGIRVAGPGAPLDTIPKGSTGPFPPTGIEFDYLHERVDQYGRKMEKMRETFERLDVDRTSNKDEINALS